MEAVDEGGCGDPGLYTAERLSLPPETVRAECERSESFRALCEEFALCADAIACWGNCNSPQAQERKLEYDECLADLGREIEEWLAEAQGAGASSGHGAGGDR